MNWRKPMLVVGLVIGLASPLLFPAPALAQNAGEAAGVQGSKSFRTLKDIRGEDVVRQRWDVSCGAAALSTVLTYDYKDPTPETAIVVARAIKNQALTSSIAAQPIVTWVRGLFGA